MWRKWSLDFKRWSMKYSIVWSLPSNKAGKELSQGCICHSSYPFNTSLSCLLSFYCLLCFIFFDPIYGDEVPSSSLTFSPTVIQCQLRRVLQGKKVYILCALKLWIELNTLLFRFCKFCENYCYVAFILSAVWAWLRKSVALLKSKCVENWNKIPASWFLLQLCREWKIS